MAVTLPIQVPSELFALAESSHFGGTCAMGTLAAGPDDYVFAQPVEWDIEITNTGGALLVSGTVTGTASTSCARCLDEVTYDLEGQIEGYLLLNAEAGVCTDDEEDEDAPGEDEFDVLPANHTFDLYPYLVAALLMDMPSVPLCSDECAGLCPQCGANLNEGPCGCAPDAELEAFAQAANPFSALADYTFE